MTEQSIQQSSSDCSLPPVVQPSWKSALHDPPVVVNEYTTADITRNSLLQTLLASQDRSGSDGGSSTAVYGVTRVFDLFTLMAITLAFALLFALLKLLSPAFDTSPATLTLVISGYVTLIALAQMFLFDGKNPRLASVVAGPIVMFAMLIAFWVPTNYATVIASLAFSSIMSVLFGFFIGYLAGAVVAGVLLVADVFRGRSRHPQVLSFESEKDLVFDDIE